MTAKKSTEETKKSDGRRTVYHPSGKTLRVRDDATQLASIAVEGYFLTKEEAEKAKDSK
jgi:hypothetical protein